MIESVFNILIASIILMVLFQITQTTIAINRKTSLNNDDFINAEYSLNFIESEINNIDEVYILDNNIVFLRIDNKYNSNQKKYNYFKFALRNSSIFRDADTDNTSKKEINKIKNITYKGNNILSDDIDSFIMDINDGGLILTIKQREVVKEKYIKLNCNIIDLRGK